MLTVLDSEGNVPIDELAKRRMKDNRGLSFDQAVDEVIADGCEMMLKDTKILQRLAKEEPGLAQKIKNFLKQFTETLRKVFSRIKAGHYEAEVMAGHFEELQKMWENALVSATENYAGKGKANSIGKGLQYSDRDGTVKSASELTESDFYNLLERVENREFSLDTYIPIRLQRRSFSSTSSGSIPMGRSRLKICQWRPPSDILSRIWKRKTDSLYGSERPHGLSKEDLVRISKEMGHPSYIVKQKNGRYAEIVSFYHSRNKRVGCRRRLCYGRQQLQILGLYERIQRWILQRCCDAI